jgi:Type II CAAX prenyl endopeptidase Rce1-like
MRTGSRTTDLWLVLAGIAGLAVSVLLYRRAFPQAAVRLEVTRPEGVATARAFLGEQGADLAAYREAVQFGGDDSALVFLQRTIGLDSASRWARDRVPLWAWHVRWFRPGQKEEWRVAVGVEGRVEAFQHVIPEAAAGADLPQDSARVLAERFLAGLGWRLADFDRVEASSQRRDKRTDHHFAWEQHGTSIAWAGAADSQAGGSGAIRLAVDVQGDAIGGYRHFLKVPDAFGRELQGTMSVGMLLAFGALGLTFALMLIAVGLSIARYRKDDIRWRPAFGLAGLVMVLMVVQSLLMWPSAQYGYPTQIPWVAYLGSLAVGLVFAAILYGLWALFPTAAGESLGRETFPASLEGFVDAARGRLRAPALARASWRGYAMGFAFLGYLSLFYLVARRYFGAWLPAEGPSSEIFNMDLPFLAPLTISLTAAITEETTYRLFGISLVKRYTGSTALALLIPAVIWAFGHSSYEVFPVYLRGIELTIGGVLFGLAFLRLGLVACIVAHFVIDAVQIGMPLLGSGNPTYVVSGVIVMGIALLPALLGWLAGRRTPQARDT